MSKDDLVRFSISLDWELLKEFDEAIQKEGYENRSFAIRTLFREFILSNKYKEQEDFSGVFVILAIFKNKFCGLCDDIFSISIPLKNNKILCCCVIESTKKEANEKFKKLNSSLDVEYCKLITIQEEKDD